jgi:predicted nucleic acid-binding protein
VVIVVDASVLTDFLLGRSRTMAALEAELAGHEHEPMHAPDLIELETLNALRRLARSGAVADRRATEAASDLARVRLIRYPNPPLRERVWALRDELTAYNAAYLALAEALDGSVLLTSDGALARRAQPALGRERVRLVV